MKPFDNESQVQRVGEFELQNRLDRIEVGAGTITRDEAGLKVVRELGEILHQIEQQLLADRDAGRLPKVVSIKQDEDAGSPFGMPARPRG